MPDPLARGVRVAAGEARLLEERLETMAAGRRIRSIRTLGWLFIDTFLTWGAWPLLVVSIAANEGPWRAVGGIGVLVVAVIAALATGTALMRKEKVFSGWTGLLAILFLAGALAAFARVLLGPNPRRLVGMVGIVALLVEIPV